MGRLMINETVYCLLIHRVAAKILRRMATKEEELASVTKRTRTDFATTIEKKMNLEGSKYVEENITLPRDVKQKKRTRAVS